MVARDFRAIESSSFLLVILRIAPFTVLMEKSGPAWREQFCLFGRFEDRSLPGKKEKEKKKKRKRKRATTIHRDSNVNATVNSQM